MKIAVMGSGGIGGYYGGRLANAGEDVTFIARGAHLAAMRAGGLRVFSHFGDFELPRVAATDDPAEIGEAELVLVTTKAYDLEAAARALVPVVGAETVVLPLLNGVDIAQRLAAVVGRGRVLGGLSKISSAISEPGVIRQVTPYESLVFGPLSGEPQPRDRALEATFRDAGIHAELSADIERDIWEKFIFLAPFAGIAALTRKLCGEIRADPDTRALLRECIEEIEAVARKQGVALAPGVVDDTLAVIDGIPPETKPSMLLDLERGRRLELDALNGTVVRLGTELGVPTPVNRFIHAALKLHAGGAA